MNSLPKIKGTYKKNFSLSKLTWFQTGGKAQVLFIPKNLLDLQFFLKNIKNTPIAVIGGGSNLLVRDGGIKGVVIKLGKGFDYINYEKKYILCGASVKNINLSSNLLKQKITGFEFLSTIPGTIGGSIFMNAGCFGKEIKDLIKSVIVINKKGKLIELKKKFINFSYRSSGISKNYFIVAAKFQIRIGNQKFIKKKIKQFLNLRKKTQPIKVLTGGSTFINPKKKKAWVLIKRSYCVNMKVGGAKISEKHCNFLVNTGTATSTDLENLGNKIKLQVYKHTGVKLNWEIKRIGIK